MTLKEIDQVLEKLNLIMEDLIMLRDGAWEPDEKSCNASIENVQDIINIIEYV
jgi:sugar phosphate isomerase/epimerase